MSTEPTAPARVTPGRSAQSGTRVITVSSPLPLAGAMITLLLGVFLGLASQQDTGAPMGLRVPALLASLLMVGQGVFDMRKHWPRKQEVETVTLPDDSQRSRELAVVHTLPAPAPVTSVAVRPTAANLSVPVGLLLLAIWLGLADLRLGALAGEALRGLSLITAFALFALGWTLLPARR